MDKKKILVIDDEKDFTQLVKLNLMGTGKYEVQTENRGSHGLAAARKFKPDLILLDILMPGMDGSEVAFQLMNNENTKNIPIVFLTVMVTREDMERRGNIVGGHPFIAKPVSKEEIVACIEKNIRK